MTRPLLLLRLEGLAVLAGATSVYAVTGSSWLLFALLLFVPDIFMVGYLAGPVAGAAIYNVGHSYVIPFLTLGVGYASSVPLLVSVGLIWTAHIGLDRMLGFGLKLPTGFRDTHLGPPVQRVSVPD